MSGRRTALLCWLGFANPLVVCFVAAQSSATSSQGGSLTPVHSPLTTSYTPNRVYDTHHKQFIDFESLAARAAGADLLFFGEQHDDPATHRMELALLEGIARRRDSVVVGLEMFERDVQPLLDGYLAGDSVEAQLLRDGRPWKNYSDYRPLVELARAKRWPVIASNVPRPLAALVGRGGLAALDSLAPVTRAQAAAAVACPEDAYYREFAEAMGGMATHGPAPASGEDPKARLARMYEAQCLKDETMAESVAGVWRPGRLVVHYNGAFHSDFGLGTAARAHRRVRDARLLIVSAIPVKQLDALKPSKQDRKRADFLIYVLAPAQADSVGH